MANCSADLNHLWNFGRRHHEDQFCEIILNLNQWFKRKCCLKVFLICSSGSSFVQQSGTICAIMVEGMRYNSRVGSHVVFAWIHCTDVRIHCTDIPIECR